jgi:hypothetical protein
MACRRRIVGGIGGRARIRDATSFSHFNDWTRS